MHLHWGYREQGSSFLLGRSHTEKCSSSRLHMAGNHPAGAGSLGAASRKGASEQPSPGTKKEGSCLPLSRLSTAPTTELKALPFSCGGQEEKEQQNPTALLLVLALSLGSACSVLYLPLGPWGRCWKAVQWSWKLPPGWSRDSGYVSHEALSGRGLRLTSKSHQRHSGNKKKKKKGK